VHSKTIVIDPFSENCAVITGSHNFSDSASTKNDENLVIVRGNAKLVQAYALHINGVYDHYSWRAFLASGGNADQIYKPLDAWKPGGSRAQELDFWMSGAVSPQPAEDNVPAPRAAPPAAVPKKRAGATPAKARKKAAGTPRAAAGTRKKATPAKTVKKTKAVKKAKTAKRAAQPKAKRKTARSR
jgi:hypothetical protein